MILLSQKTNKSVYETQLENGKKVIVLIVSVNSNEANMIKIANSLGLTPKIISITNNNNLTNIVMEYWDIPYSAYILKEKNEKVINLVKSKLLLLHSNHIYHGDLNFSNIMINLNPLDVSFIDFEYSSIIPNNTKIIIRDYYQEGTFIENLLFSPI